MAIEKKCYLLMHMTWCSTHGRSTHFEVHFGCNHSMLGHYFNVLVAHSNQNILWLDIGVNDLGFIMQISKSFKNLKNI